MSRWLPALKNTSTPRGYSRNELDSIPLSLVRISLVRKSLQNLSEFPSAVRGSPPRVARPQRPLMFTAAGEITYFLRPVSGISDG